MQLLTIAVFMQYIPVLRQLVKDFSAHAVVDLTWQGCQTYDVESFSLGYGTT